MMRQGGLSRRVLAVPQTAPMTPVIVPFGEWRPDLPVLANPGLIIAKNCIPAEQSYRPFKGLAVQSDALTARARGAIAIKNSSGNTFLYAGDATKLYQITNQSVTNKSGATYNTSENWDTAVYGQTVIFTNLTDAVQSIAAGSGSNFADMITSTLKPKAKRVGTVRDFVVLGHTNDATDGVMPNRVWWSAYNDETDFDPDSATQCDYQDIRDGGAVQRIVGGADYGVIFQEFQITRMSYTGDRTVFRFDAMDRRRGTPLPGSVVGHGRLVFYMSEEGLFVFDGTSSHPIGANKFDRWFWDQFDIGNAERVSAAVDFVNKLYVLAFPGEDSSAGGPNKLLLYNWHDRKASYVDIETQIVFRAATQAYSLEDLDSIGSNIDDTSVFTVSFDDPQWQGGLYRFSAFNTDNKLCFFTGNTLAAQWDTGDRQIFRGRRGYIDNLRNLVEGDSVTVTAYVGGRDLLTSSNSYGTGVTANSTGLHTVSNNSRYHRFKLTTAAADDWDHCQGIEVYAREGGIF